MKKIPNEDRVHSYTVSFLSVKKPTFRTAATTLKTAGALQ
jgi:hypothetical protein